MKYPSSLNHTYCPIHYDTHEEERYFKCSHGKLLHSVSTKQYSTSTRSTSLLLLATSPGGVGVALGLEDEPALVHRQVPLALVLPARAFALRNRPEPHHSLLVAANLEAREQAPEESDREGQKRRKGQIDNGHKDKGQTED